MDDLEKLYRETSYVVEDGDTRFTIRLSEPNNELRDFLASRQATSWAFLTAYNPRSEPLTHQENLLRQTELVKLLDDRYLTSFSGQGVGDDPSWEPEPSLFIIDIDRDSAIEIGRQFEQNAILWGDTNDQIELIWCQPSIFR